MLSLEQFLQQTRDTREYKRALAVQMRQQGIATPIIQTTLQISAPFISKWTRIYAESGTDGFRIKYRGSRGKLDAAERAAVIAWIQAQARWNVDRLRAYLADTFGITYQSRQSYYDLLHAAGISWKQAQATNPKKTMRPSRPNGPF